ncbi:MAG: hypothetical protein ACXVRU_00345 [Gaiellaceae bacterium]
MKLVLTTVFDEGDAAAAEKVQFHLAAGVDLILASVADEQVARSLQSFVDKVAIAPQGADDTERVRLAATTHGADWIISADTREFWWPRGENLKEVLAPIPERYTIVQGLRRDFPPGETTRRSSPEDGKGAVLRPVFRADPAAVVQSDGSVVLRRVVPLRAWYPIEVMYSGPQQYREVEDLVVDTRLLDALQAIRNGATELTFRVPDIVEDARYAAECAAVGEVELPKLEQYITELEQRVEWLEQRFWPRVLRRLTRVARRSS